MNWKLIFGLSLFGAAMAFAGVFGLLSPKAEPWLWLGIFAIYAVVIARNTTRKRYGHGFWVNVLNGGWFGLIHAAFYQTYLRHNPDMIQQHEQMVNLHFAQPEVMILLLGPVFGALIGLVGGLFPWAAGRFIRTT
jgi:hypothetical protein